MGGEKTRVDKIFPLEGDAARWRDEKKVELKAGARALPSRNDPAKRVR